MVLVQWHDEDLVLISENYDSNVSRRDFSFVVSNTPQLPETLQPDGVKICLETSNAKIHKVSWGELLLVS